MVSKISWIWGGRSMVGARVNNLPIVVLKLPHQSFSARSVWMILASGKACIVCGQTAAPGQSTCAV